MAILWRSWLAFITIIAVILSTFSLLFYLQFHSILSELIVHRLSVVAHTTANSFQSVTDLGLPFEMVNNAEVILKRSKETDTNIKSLHAFSPSGLIVYSTDPLHKHSVLEEVVHVQVNSDQQDWGTETEKAFYSGSSIYNDSDQLIGGVVIDFPKTVFNAQKKQLANFLIIASSMIFATFTLISLIVLKIRLSKAIRGVKHLEDISQHLSEKETEVAFTSPSFDSGKKQFGLLGPIISNLKSRLVLADGNYQTAKSYLTDARFVRNPGISPRQDKGIIEEHSEVNAQENNLAESLAKKLIPLAAILVTLAVVILGFLSIDYIGKSIAPEIVNRTKLIGEIVNANIQRAVSAGVPLDKIVGADRYLDKLLRDFQEVSYIGIVDDEPIVEVGKRERSSLSPTQLLEDELIYSISHDDQIIGRIIIDVDSTFIAQQFREVYMDLIVVIMVAVLITFESMVVMIGRTITTPIQRVHTLATMQALGDFSKYAITRGKDGFDHILDVLSRRANEHHDLMSRAITLSLKSSYGPAESDNLKNIKARFHLFLPKPKLLTFSNLNDIRWPLFLFIAADELPLSFFPLFTRAAENPWGWLDQGIVISLPLIGYLLAIFTSSPVARLLTSVVGHRKLLFFAMAPAVVTHIGLFFSTTVPEIVLFRTLSGFGYAIATLTYQDYVLDMIPKEHRTKSIGNFTAVLVGGIFCGTAIGGILADRLGQHAVFLISAILVVISCVLILLFIPSQDKTSDTKYKIEVKPLSILKALSDKHFSSLVFGIAMPCNIIMQAFIAFLVALYMNELGASTAETGRTLMGYFLMIYFVGPVSTKLSDKRVTPSIVILLGAVIAGASLLFAGLVATKQALLFAVLGAGVGHGLVRSHQLSVVMDIAESSLFRLGLNVVLGTLRTLERGGSILGLLAVAWLYGLVGYQGAISMIGLLSLLGVVLFFFGNMVGIKISAENRRLE